MKKQFGIRIEKELIDRAKKLAEQNKKNFKLPDSYNSVIEQALAEYLARKELHKNHRENFKEMENE